MHGCSFPWVLGVYEGVRAWWEKSETAYASAKQERVKFLGPSVNDRLGGGQTWDKRPWGATQAATPRRHGEGADGDAGATEAKEVL